MKSYLLLFATFFSSVIYAQRIGMIGVYSSETFPYIECLQKGEKIVIRFQDDNTLGASGFEDEFEITPTEFDKVYENVVAGFENKKRVDIEIETTTGYATIEFDKQLGVMAFRFTMAKRKGALGVSYSTWVMKKEVPELFGKK